MTEKTIQHYTDDEKKNITNIYREGTLGRKDFCRRAGITPSALRIWEYRFHGNILQKLPSGPQAYSNAIALVPEADSTYEVSLKDDEKVCAPTSDTAVAIPFDAPCSGTVHTMGVDSSPTDGAVTVTVTLSEKAIALAISNYDAKQFSNLFDELCIRANNIPEIVKAAIKISAAACKIE